MEPFLPYLEREPRTRSLETPPLLILLHGRAAEAKTIFSIEGLLDPRYHVIAIRGTYESELGGYEWFHPESKMRSDEINDAKRFEESENLLTENVRSHIDRLGAQDYPRFFWGFSQGAAMSLILGLRGLLKPRGVVPMGGFLPSPVRRWNSWDTSAEYLFVHGAQDEVLPPETSITAKAFLDSKGVRTEYHEYRGRHKMSLESIRFVNDWIATKAAILL